MSRRALFAMIAAFPLALALGRGRGSARRLSRGWVLREDDA